MKHVVVDWKEGIEEFLKKNFSFAEYKIVKQDTSNYF